MAFPYPGPLPSSLGPLPSSSPATPTPGPRPRPAPRPPTPAPRPQTGKKSKAKAKAKATPPRGKIKQEADKRPVDHVRPVDTYEPDADDIRVAASTGLSSWRSRELSRDTRDAVLANAWYNMECRTVNRQRSMPIEGNTDEEWPIYLRMCDIVTGLRNMTAPATRGAIQRTSRTRWVAVGRFYDLPWVPATPIEQIRLDYTAFLGALDT